MPCYKPLQAWQHTFSVVSTGEAPKIHFSGTPNGAHKRLEIPCGKCIGCRLEYSRKWAIRIMHEAQMHEQSCFATLTYDNEHLPENNSLRKKDVQDFLKRARSHFKRNGNRNIRFYNVGEYGEQNGRPHYHCILFGVDFYQDRVLEKTTKDGHRLYTSPTLDKLWPHGLADFGELTFESAAYCARYCTKKLTALLRRNTMAIGSPNSPLCHLNPA